MLTCAGLVLNGVTSTSSGKMHIHLHKNRSPEPWSHLHGLLLPINYDKLLMQWSPHTSIHVSIFTRTQSSRTGSSLTHFCILSRRWWLHVIPQETELGTPAQALVLRDNRHASYFEPFTLRFLLVALSFQQCFLWNVIDPTLYSLSSKSTSKSTVSYELTPTFQNPKKVFIYSISWDNWNVWV